MTFRLLASTAALALFAQSGAAQTGQLAAAPAIAPDKVTPEDLQQIVANLRGDWR